MISEPEITLDELLSELDQYRIKPKLPGLTEEQKQFLILARENENPVPYNKIVLIWSKKWGSISEEALRKKYLKATGKMG